MAAKAVCRSMDSCQWECGPVMIKSARYISCWMTRQACVIIKYKPRNSLMLRPSLRLSVTSRTSHVGVITGIYVTLGAKVPGPGMGTAVDWKIGPVMIDLRFSPIRFVVALRAVIAQLQ